MIIHSELCGEQEGGILESAIITFHLLLLLLALSPSSAANERPLAGHKYCLTSDLESLRTETELDGMLLHRYLPEMVGGGAEQPDRHLQADLIGRMMITWYGQKSISLATI